MPLWSLTQERVERLRKQMGDQEMEVDALLKKSKEDLWNADLDEFIKEWRFQLDDEAKRRKKARSLGRRASQKLKIGAAGPKKRKAIGYGSDDSDFGASKAKKPAAAKPAPKPKPGGLLSEPLAKVNQPKPRVSKAKAAAEVKLEKKAENAVSTSLGRADTAMSEAPIASIFQKTKAAAAASKPPAPAKIGISEDDEDDDDEIIRKPAGRKARAAASKPVTYGLEGDSDDSGDAMLFDVGKMVKGINGSTGDANSRPLFSTASSISRPGSSHGLPKKPTSASARVNDFDGADDTDYSKLAPPTTKKGSAVTARHTVLSDEEDDSFDAMMAASKPAAPKPAAKNGASKAAQVAVSKPAASKVTTAKAATAKAPPVKKALAAAAPPKKLPLSPAAKAYAAKQAKRTKVVHDDSSEDEDEVEKVANEIMDDGEDDEDDDDLPATRRPARRAAAVAPKKTWVVASGSEDEEEEEESAVFEADDSDEY